MCFLFYLFVGISKNAQVGDSVFLKNPPKDTKGKLQVLTRLYNYKPKKFTCQPEGNGARVWRIK